MFKKYLLLFLIPILIGFLYWGNIKPFKASQIAGKGNSEKAFSYNTFINHEIRKAMAHQAVQSEDSSFILFTLNQMEQNITERPYDAKSYILLTYLYYRLGQNDKALQTAEKALKLAPNKPDVQEILENLEQGEEL